MRIELFRLEILQPRPKSDERLAGVDLWQALCRELPWGPWTGRSRRRL